MFNPTLLHDMIILWINKVCLHKYVNMLKISFRILVLQASNM